MKSELYELIEKKIKAFDIRDQSRGQMYMMISRSDRWKRKRDVFINIVKI